MKRLPARTRVALAFLIAFCAQPSLPPLDAAAQVALHSPTAVLLVEVMRSDSDLAPAEQAAVQQALQTTLWMLPVEPGTPRDPALRLAETPARFDNPTPQAMAERASDWVGRWTRVVLK